MSASLDRGTTIGQLRLRAATADPSALRMRAGTAVGALDLQPPAMPEQAILCIRTLYDPMPGGLDLRFAAAPRPAAWETAMRGAVAMALRRAARPALGPVPANADAVLFADRSELLACAAQDASRGALLLHWWWTHLLGERSPAAVVREWTRAPAYVPGAVEWLAVRGEVTLFLGALVPTEAVRLLDSVLRVHALPALASKIVQALTASPAPLIPLPLSEPGDAKHRTVPSLAEPYVPPPWRAIVPDLSSAELTVEQRALAALALVLRRAPVLARSERFATETVAWIGSERRREQQRDISVTIRPIKTDRTDTLRIAAVQGESEKSSATSELEPWSEEPQQPAAQRPEPRVPEQTVATVEASKSDPSTQPRQEAKPETALPEPRPALSSMIEEPPARDAAPASGIIDTLALPEATEPPPRPDLAIDTDFAGVFFLLNVGIALGLYSDFTSPVQYGIALDVWDFLALTGPALMEMESFGDDPVGPFLAILANRKEGEPPGTGFVPPDGQPPREWLETTILRIRERLALAGLEDPARIVHRYGRVTTTPTHLDVYFSLAAHPIEIRLAGLDRNPGWVPAAGRHVAFHFD